MQPDRCKKKMYKSSQFGSTGYSSGHRKVHIVLEVSQNGGSVVSMPQGQGLPFPVVPTNNMCVCVSMKIAALTTHCYPCTEKP